MRRQAKRRPMLNDAGDGLDHRNPANWGGADMLPLARTRVPHESVWEKLFHEHGPGTKKGWFTAEMLQAAQEIGWVFMAVSGGLMPRSHMGERTGSSPEADWSERLTIAYRDRYKPWALAMTSHAFLTQDPVHAFIIDLAVEDVSVTECERRNGVWRGKGVKMIQYGLGMYVTMAGWTNRRPKKY